MSDFQAVDGVFWIGLDLFNLYFRSGSSTAAEIYDRIRVKDVEIIPSPSLQYLIGTKRYTSDPFIKSRMISGTLTYPDDTQQIRNLPTESYVVKLGGSGSSQGIRRILATAGSEIIDFIEHQRFDDFAIVQPYTELFGIQAEAKFFVVGGKINSLYLQGITTGTLGYYDQLLGQTLDVKIQEFLYEIWDYFADSYGMTMLRIDIILSNPGAEPWKKLFNLGDSDIYLNEIETIASGGKYYTSYSLNTSHEFIEADVDSLYNEMLQDLLDLLLN